MRPAIYFLFIVFLFKCFSCYSQPTNFIHYTVADGLPSNTIYHGFEDHQGYMWFSTGAGVSRFDGYEFTNFSTEDGLGDNEVFFGFEDSQNRIWFSTLNGRVSYYQNGQFFNSGTDTTFRALERDSRITSISEMKDGTIVMSFISHGTLGYTPQRTVIKYDTLNETNRPFIFSGVNESGHLISAHPRSLKVFRNNESYDVWKNVPPAYLVFGHQINNQFYFSQGHNLYLFDFQKGCPSLLFDSPFTINNVCRGPDEQLYLCTESGIIQYPEQKTLLPDQKIAFVLDDSEKNTWAGTLGNGLFFSTGLKIKNYTKKEGLIQDNVNAIQKDLEDNIWLGHNKLSLSKIEKNKNITSFEYNQFIPKESRDRDNTIIEILFEGKEMWISCMGFTLHLNDNGGLLLTGIGGKDIVRWSENEFIFSLGPNGLFRFNPNSPFIKNYPRTIKEITFLNWDQVYKKIDRPNFYQSRTTKLHLEAPKKLWAGLNSGLIYLQEDTLIEYHHIYPELKQRVSDITTNSLGIVFIATNSSGVYLMKDSTLTHISVKKGLSSNLCTVIESENDSTIWVGTNHGLNRIDFSQSYALKNIEYINSSTGLPSDYINNIFVDDNEIWVATPQGASNFDTGINLFNTHPPKMRITGAAGRNGRISMDNPIELHHLDNNLKIDYVGLSYKSQKNINYKYRLKTNPDDEPKWKFTQNRSVEFSLLPPNNYNFQVAAQNSSGVWSEAANLSFRIRPPYWQTIWFITSSGLVLLIFFALIVWYLFRRQQKKEMQKRLVLSAEIKSLKSQMNFHFLSNAFTSMQRFFIAHTDLYEHIEKFSLLMRYNLEHADQDLVPLSEELEYLKLYVSTEQTRTRLSLDFNINEDPALDCRNILIPSLSLQPFIENAIKHGVLPKNAPGIITLCVKPLDNDYYSIIITDNGVGYNHSMLAKSSKKRKSHGMDLVKDRFKIVTQDTKLEFQVNITDRSGDGETGTKVGLKLPYIAHE